MVRGTINLAGISFAEDDERGKEAAGHEGPGDSESDSDIAKLLEIDEEEVNRIILQNTDAAVES